MFINSEPRAGRLRPYWLVLALAAAMLIAGCASAGEEATTTTTTAATTTTEAATTTTGAAASSTTTTTEAVALPSCGTDDVVLNAYFETGFILPFDLSDEFTT